MFDYNDLIKEIWLVLHAPRFGFHQFGFGNDRTDTTTDKPTGSGKDGVAIAKIGTTSKCYGQWKGGKMVMA